MTPQELKNSILQLAIQGKLVEQRPEEGTAEELYREIQKEKARLIKEGKIKKDKPLPEITEEEKPFDIPESWMWVRLGSLATVVTKGTTPRGGNVAYLDKGIGFLRAENIAGLDALNLSDLKYIDEETHLGFLSRSIIQENDILITIAGTLGRTGIVRKKDLPLNANQAVSMVRPVNAEIIDLLYIIYALNSTSIQKALTTQKKVTAIPNLTLEIISECLIPLPPLAEQKRIVAKIQELQPLIDRYEKAWSRLEDFNKRFPTDMQKSILQMAIQGKLVEQRPEEGTGEELYRQIQAEKAKLVKEGKIKKEKPLPEIAEEEVPFEIPGTWKWCRIGSIFNLQAGKNVTSSVIYEEESEQNRYLCYGGNGVRGYVNRFNREGFFAIIGRQGALCGNINLANGSFYATEHAVVVEHFNKTDVLWGSYFLTALRLNQYATATAQPGLAVAKINQALIPLPPLAEQKRIVAKLEELLPLCERLKSFTN